MSTGHMSTGHLDGIRVWDGTADAGVCELRWSGDRFDRVGPAATERWPDLTVIPGLVDTHVHLLGHGGAPDAPRRHDTLIWPLVTEREEQVLHAAANAQRAMRHGVTTLRDLAADTAQASLRRVFEEGVLPGPRLLASGPVGMTAGHHDLFTPPAHKLRGPSADSPDECRKLVRTWARAGLTGIKIFTSGGVLSTGDKVAWRNHTRAEIAATIDEAHALGMLVAAHAHSVEGIQVAIEEGADSIEHGTEVTAEQAEALAASRTPVAPTLLINELIAAGHGGIGPEPVAKAAALVARRDELFAAAAAAGVRFVLGTDASGYFVRFGDQMAEVVRMAEVFGLDGEAVLRAATSDAAEAIGLGEEVGRVAGGYGADFVVMSGRPWLDITELTTDNIRAVVCRGELVAGTLPVP